MRVGAAANVPLECIRQYKTAASGVSVCVCVSCCCCCCCVCGCSSPQWPVSVAVVAWQPTGTGTCGSYSSARCAAAAVCVRRQQHRCLLPCVSVAWQPTATGTCGSYSSPCCADLCVSCKHMAHGTAASAGSAAGCYSTAARQERVQRSECPGLCRVLAACLV